MEKNDRLPFIQPDTIKHLSSSSGKSLSTCSSADLFVQAIHTLSAVLNSYLSSVFLKLKPSSLNDPRSPLFTLMQKSYFSKLFRPFTQWRSIAQRISSIASGMKILEKQKNRRNSKKRKEMNGNKDFQQVQQEKAMDSVFRVFRRVNSGLMSYSFSQMLKRQIKNEKVEFCKKLGIKVLSVLMKIKIKGYFCKVIEDRTEILMNRFRLVFEKMNRICSDRKRSVLGELRKTLFKAFIPKASLALEKVRKLCQKVSFAYFSALTTPLFLINSLKFQLAYHKLHKILFSQLHSSFIKLKSPLIPKIQLFAASFLSNKIAKIQKAHKRSGLHFLTEHKNQASISKAFSILSILQTEKAKAFKSFFLSTLKSYISLLNSRNMIWRIKFYQLEGLIQHKNEETIRKIKSSRFFIWSLYVKKISESNRKASKRRIEKLCKKISKVLEKMKKTSKVQVFTFIKSIYVSQKACLNSLEKIYKKQLKLTYFAYFKAGAWFTSESAYSRQSYTAGIQNDISPRQSLSMKNCNQASKRYGFYSNKKMSLDNSVHKYVDQMTKLSPPHEKNNFFSYASPNTSVSIFQSKPFRSLKK